MRSIIKNKRGDATSLIVGVVIIFTIALISILFSRFFGEVITILKADSSIASNPNSLETLNVLEANYIPWLDYFFLFTFIATIIGLAISSMFIDVHPGFMIFFIILLVIAILFGAILSNVYTTIGETDSMNAVYTQFTSTKAIMDNLPWILFIVGLIVVIILYGKSHNSGGGQPM